MDKILICVSIPAIRQKYDLFIPGHLPLTAVLPLLARAVSEASDGSYVPSGKEILCSCSPYGILAADRSLTENGVVNGDTVLLF